MGSSRVVSDREAVAAYYDRLAPVYGDGEFFGARRAALVAQIADDLVAADRVLDLGCGNGAFGVEFVARAPHALVVGADLSPAMLAAAHRRLGGRVRLLQADAGALPFRPNSFDLVFMSHVLLLVADVEHCIAGIADSLTSGGKLVATVGVGTWRTALGAIVSPEEMAQIDALFGARRLRRSNDVGRVAAACSAHGLRSESRSIPFSASWHALEEWIRIRWFTMVDESQRTQAERWMSAVRSRAAGFNLRLAETVVVATKVH